MSDSFKMPQFIKRLMIRKKAIPAAADCNKFEFEVIADIFENDAELISFVRKAIGYSLTGSTAEQCMLIMIADGANGKSTFINLINQLLGTYGTTAAAQTLVAQGGTSIGDD